MSAFMWESPESQDLGPGCTRQSWEKTDLGGMDHVHTDLDSGKESGRAQAPADLPSPSVMCKKHPCGAAEKQKYLGSTHLPGAYAESTPLLECSGNQSITVSQICILGSPWSTRSEVG